MDADEAEQATEIAAGTGAGKSDQGQKSTLRRLAGRISTCSQPRVSGPSYGSFCKIRPLKTALVFRLRESRLRGAREHTKSGCNALVSFI